MYHHQHWLHWQWSRIERIQNHFCWTSDHNASCFCQLCVWIMSFGRVVEFWNWRRILKCLFTFLFFAGSKIRTNCSAISVLKSPILIYILKAPQNTFHSNIKKHNNKNLCDIRHKFQHSTPCPNDMIYPLYVNFWSDISAPRLQLIPSKLTKSSLVS